jgi:histidinol-phosphate/aromatic aminotransferase/cobyric acid decarboxylase-like protein
MPAWTQVDELKWLETIYRLGDKYQELYGTEALDVSHWDPSPEIKRSLLPRLSTRSVDLIDYIYSYNLDLRLPLIRKLGFPTENKCCLITPASTISMLCVVALLAATGRNLTILCPYYFPLAHQCSLIGLPFRRAYLLRVNNRFILPSDCIETLKNEDILWMTNPIYCTGVYLEERDIDLLKSFLERGGTVVVDESLSLNGYEMAARLGQYEGYWGIYSPHKSVCVNGLKFSALVTSSKNEDFLERWSDIIYGGLSASSLAALNHFLSEDFQAYSSKFLEFLAPGRKFLEDLSASLPSMALDNNTVGHFVTCYFPELGAELARNEDFLWGIVQESGSTFIPGLRNHFSPEWGFCFRVNLALSNPQHRSALARLSKSVASAVASDV